MNFNELLHHLVQHAHWPHEEAQKEAHAVVDANVPTDEPARAEDATHE